MHNIHCVLFVILSLLGFNALAAEDLLEAETISANSPKVLLQSLIQSPSVDIHEGLPHQTYEGRLLKQELKRSDTTQIGGYSFYTPKYVASDKTLAALKTLICLANNIEEYSGEKRCGGFHPDFAISWMHMKQPVSLLICFGCSEVLFVHNNNKYRYDFKNMHALKKALHTYYLKRPHKHPQRLELFNWHHDSVEIAVSAHLRAALNKSTNIHIHEGLPHPSNERDLFKRESVRTDTLNVGGHLFYPAKTAPPEKDVRYLVWLLSNEQNINQFFDEKKCGGFHPDYAVSWQHDDSTAYALLCFGCGEILYMHADKKYRYNLNDRNEVRAQFKAFQSKRPQRNE